MSFLDSILSAEFAQPAINVKRYFSPNPVKGVSSGKAARVTGAGYISNQRPNYLTGFTTTSFLPNAGNTYTTKDTLGLSNGNVIYMYWDSTATAALKAAVISINYADPTNVVGTPGTGVVLTTGGSNPYLYRSRPQTKLFEIDPTHVLTIWSEGTVIKSTILTLSGNSITNVGTVVSLTTTLASDQLWEACLLSSGTYLIAYGGASSYPNAIAFTATGTTITAGTSVVLDSAFAINGSCISVDTVDNGLALIGYTYVNTNYYLSTIAVSVSGTTITAGAKTSQNGGANSGYLTRVYKVSASKAVVFTTFAATNGYYFTGISLNGTTQTVSIALVSTIYHAGMASYPLVMKSKSVNGVVTFCVAYSSNGASTGNYGANIFCWAVKDDLSAWKNSVLPETNVIYNTTPAVSEYTSLHGYYDQNSSGFIVYLSLYDSSSSNMQIIGVSDIDAWNIAPVCGQSKILETSNYTAASYAPNPMVAPMANGYGILICEVNMTYVMSSKFTIFRGDIVGKEFADAFVGIVDSGGNAVFRGFCDGCTVVPGTSYYLDVAGGTYQLTTTSTNNKYLGFALSVTELYLKDISLI